MPHAQVLHQAPSLGRSSCVLLLAEGHAQAEKTSQVGLICDRLGRKTALVATTLLIILGATLGICLHIDRFYNIG
jgi:hypothetical protein